MEYPILLIPTDNFSELILTRTKKLVRGVDWGFPWDAIGDRYAHIIITNYAGEIIASTNNLITPKTLIPESFIDTYIDYYNRNEKFEYVNISFLECKQPDSCSNSLSKKCVCPNGVKEIKIAKTLKIQ